MLSASLGLFQFQDASLILWKKKSKYRRIVVTCCWTLYCCYSIWLLMLHSGYIVSMVVVGSGCADIVDKIGYVCCGVRTALQKVALLLLSLLLWCCCCCSAAAAAAAATIPIKIFTWTNYSNFSRPWEEPLNNSFVQLTSGKLLKFYKQDIDEVNWVDPK